MDGSTSSRLHDPASMRDVLQRCLVSCDGTPLVVRECRIANTRRRDGSRGTVEYEATFEHPASGQVWEQRVTGVAYGGGRTRRVWEALRQGGAAGANNGLPHGLPSFAYVAELDLLLQVFPHDHRLPALAGLMEEPPPELVPALLAAFGEGAWTLTRWAAEPVQYRVDMRAILRVTAQAQDRHGAAAERSFHAKIYREGEAARRAFAAQRDISAQAAEASGILVAARPIALLDAERTVVTESLPGTSLSRLIRRGDEVAAAMQAAARAVAAFHQLDVPAPPRPVAEEVSQLRQAAAFLIAERPDLADAMSAIVQTIVGGLAEAPVALIHGDLKPDHILIADGRAALLDFDLIAAADPIADVAHLLAFLGKPQERARARRDPSAAAADIFLEEYFALAPASWRERLPIYHAITAIHKAVGLARRRGEEGRARVEDVIREAEEILGGEAGPLTPTFKRRMTRTTRRTR